MKLQMLSGTMVSARLVSAILGDFVTVLRGWLTSQILGDGEVADVLEAD